MSPVAYTWGPFSAKIFLKIWFCKIDPFPPPHIDFNTIPYFTYGYPYKGVKEGKLKNQSKSPKKKMFTGVLHKNPKMLERLVTLCLLLKRIKTGRGKLGCLLFASTPLLHSDSSLWLSLQAPAKTLASWVWTFFFFFCCVDNRRVIPPGGRIRVCTHCWPKPLYYARYRRRSS